MVAYADSLLAVYDNDRRYEAVQSRRFISQRKTNSNYFYCLYHGVKTLVFRSTERSLVWKEEEILNFEVKHRWKIIIIYMLRQQH